MNTRNQLLCAWSGIAFTLIFMVGILFMAHFVPPPSPNASAADIAALYQSNTTMIRLGLVLMMGSSGLICPFVALISQQMKRMEGKPSILSAVQMSSGTAGVPFLILPCLIFSVAAFRPDRDPELTRLINDMGWMVFLMPFGTFIVQNFAIGFAVLGDRNPIPVLPRWLGFFTMWVGVLFIPGSILTFFKTGPFAWDGIFPFWIPLVVFFAWYLLMFHYLRQAVLSEAAHGS